MRHRPCTGHKGFSLLELMLAIGIISILALMASNATGRYVAKARRAEVYVQVQAIAALWSSYVIENNTGPPLGAYEAMGLVSDPSSTTDGCLVPNELGYKVSDCRKVRYHVDIGFTVQRNGVDASKDLPKMARAINFVEGGAATCLGIYNKESSNEAGFWPCFFEKRAVFPGCDAINSADVIQYDYEMQNLQVLSDASKLCY